MLRTSPLYKDTSVRIVGKAAPLSPAIEKIIETEWTKERSKRGDQLFNGPVLSFIALEGREILAFSTDYRCFLAQRKLPSLSDTLKIRALAVSGLAKRGNELVFGKRSNHVTQDPGMWELVPSGGLAIANLNEQLFQELEEEIGVSRKHVESLEPFALVEDPTAFTVDVGISLSLAANCMDAATPHSDEYSKFAWVEESKLGAWLMALTDGGLSPVSRELLRLRGFHLIKPPHQSD